MDKIDINHMVDLGDKGDKILKIIHDTGFYCEIGREAEAVNKMYKGLDEFTKLKLIKLIKDINPYIHGKYGLY